MSKPKVDIHKLNQMLRAGKKVGEIAKFFSVTPGAISQHKKNLHLAVIKNVVAENAHRVVSQNLDTIEQLQKINNNANELLDLCMAWQRGDKDALRILESQVRYVMVGSGENKETVKEFKIGDPRELALKAMGEIRNQLRLQLEIFQSLYDMRAVSEFQAEIIELLGETDPALRNEFIARLRKKKAVRSMLEFPSTRKGD